MANFIDQAKAFVIDLAERAAKTYVQAFAGAIALAYVAQAANFNAVDIEAWKKVVGAASAAGVAAVLSLIMSVVSGFKTGTASASKTVAQTAVVPASNTGTGTLTVQPADATQSTTETVQTGTEGATVAVQTPAP